MIIENLKYAFNKEGMLPVFLILGMTYRCNAKCSFCFVWKELNNKELVEKELKIEEIEKISKNLNHVSWLLLTGGEPFLEPRKVVESCKIFYRQNHTRNITIPTNAILTPLVTRSVKEILDSCPELSLTITLSLDGVGKEHDRLRGFDGNFESFLKTYNQLVEVRKEYPRFSINLNTVVSNQSIKDVPKLIDYVKNNLEPNYHSFEMLRGDPMDHDLTHPPLNEFRKLLDTTLKDYWKSFPFYNTRYSRFIKASKIFAREKEIEILEKKEQVVPCQAGKVTGVIRSDGLVQHCELREPVGNIRDYDYDFSKLWFDTKSNKLRKSIENKECYCSHSCFVSSSILFNPAYYGKLLEYAVKYSS